jgi:hypothetical protein
VCDVEPLDDRDGLGKEPVAESEHPLAAMCRDVCLIESPGSDEVVVAGDDDSARADGLSHGLVGTGVANEIT